MSLSVSGRLGIIITNVLYLVLQTKNLFLQIIFYPATLFHAAPQEFIDS